MDGGNGVFCLVVADHLEFSLAGVHQGYDLPCRPHKRLAVADELELTDWVDHLDHSTSLSIEHDPIAEGLPSAVIPTQDGDGLGINLRDDRVTPQHEVWDINKHPGLCSEPEHLHRGQMAIITPPAGNVALLV